MKIDVRAAARLRGHDPIDLMSALAPIVGALQASTADLSKVRVVCDWIQYRASFREPADYRPVLAAGWRAGPDPAARAGARLLQVDEPFLAGYPEDIALAVQAINIVTDVPGVHWTLHVCYGNRYSRPLRAGHYDFLFPAVRDTTVDQLALEFARKGDEDLVLLEQYQWDRGLGLGVIDVKTDQVETREPVATRIRRALRFVAPEKLSVNPDCGLRHLPPQAARAKLKVMVAGAAEVRAELGSTAT
jgi:5-methyltetrahydropteroyltriglutamate--homocysteine methyltransferase